MKWNIVNPLRITLPSIRLLLLLLLYICSVCTTRTWVKWSGWTPSSDLPSMLTLMSRSQGPVPSELTAARGTSSTSVIRWLITAKGPGITYLLHKGLWRGHGDVIKALLTLCAGNSPVTGEFPSQRPVTRSLMFSLISSWIMEWWALCLLCAKCG